MKITAVLRSKLLLIPLLLLITLYLFAWAALPRLVQWQAGKQVLEKSGHVLKMGTPELNPFKLTLLLPQLNLTTPEGEQLVAFERLFIDLSGTDLFTGLVALDQIDLQKLQLNVALLPEGKNNFTTLIDAFKTDEPEDENKEPPALLLSHLLISNAVVDFHDRRTPDGLKTRLEPLNLELHDLATRSSENGEFQLDALTGLDAALKLRAKLQLDNPSAVGELKLTGLNIAKLEPLLKPLLPLAPPTGFADLGLAFDVNLKVEGENAQPSVVLNNINAEVREFAIQPSERKGLPIAQFSSLKLNNGSFNLQENKAGLDSLNLAGLQLLHGNKGKAIGLNSIAVEKIAVNLAEQDATVGSLKVQGGAVNVKRTADGELDLLATVNQFIPASKPAASKPSPSQPEQPATSQPATKPWTYSLGSVAIAGINADFEDQGMKPMLKVGITNLALATENISQNLDTKLPLTASLNLQSGGNISVKGNLNPSKTALQLDVDANSIGLKPAQPFISQFVKLDLASGTVSTKGKVIYNDKTQSYTGSLAVAGLRLNETGTAKSFLQFKRLASPSLSANSKGVNIQRLSLDGLDTALLIAKDKSTNISRILVNKEGAPSPAKAEKIPSAKGEAAPDFAVNIDRFNIVNSELDFSDESLFIPFGTRIHSLNGVVNGLSSKPGARGELTLKGAVDDFGEAQAQGSLNLLDPTAFMDIAVNFRNVEMRSLTAYSGTFANRKIESGKLSMKLDYKIDNQQLNSSNQVTIDKLTLGERVQSPQGRDLPLELAIAILEDSNGRIDLGLPITGNLNDPEFSYGAIVWKAIGNVLTKIVTAPFRALGSLFGGGEQEVGNVAFSAGENALSPSQREGLKKLGEALNTRPNMALTVQGTWATVDKAAMQNLKMRKAVATQAGEKLEVNEDPGPLALNNQPTQKAIENLFEKRFGAGELAALKAGFRKANPGQLEQNAAGKAIGQINNLFRETRELSSAEVDALKGKNFHGVLAQKLQDAQEVSAAELQTLANQRQQVVSAGLVAAGVATDRVKTSTARETKAADDKTVPIALEVSAKK